MGNKSSVDDECNMGKELARRDTQQLLREMRGVEGTRHNSPDFQAGYVFAFELNDEQRNQVLRYVETHGCSIGDAMKVLELGGLR